MQAGAAYATARKRLIDLMTAASPDERDTRVPACPDWRTRDVLAHVVGIAVDTLDGQIAGAGTEEWTERQVDERRDRSVEDLVSEWEGVADRLDAALDTFHPAIAGGFIGDLVTHEQDVRGALGKPGGRDDEAFEIALDSYVRFFGRRIKENDLPGLVVRSEGREWTLGKNDVVGELSGDPFEVLRSLTGRRTLDQVRALQWTTDPEPFLPIVSMYGIPAAPLSE